MKKISHYVFSGYLDEGERILEVVRRHILVFKIDAAKASFFGLIVPAALWWLIPQGKVVFVIWIFIGLCGVFYHFLDWYYDVWLITNSGIVYIERKGFFDIKTIKVEYHLVEDISYSIRGVWQTLFNYGDITIDKMVANSSIMLKDAASPKKVERMIKSYQEKFVVERSIKDHHKLKGMLSEMIAYHIQNNKIKVKDQ